MEMPLVKIEASKRKSIVTVQVTGLNVPGVSIQQSVAAMRNTCRMLIDCGFIDTADPDTGELLLVKRIA